MVLAVFRRRRPRGDVPAYLASSAFGGGAGRSATGRGATGLADRLKLSLVGGAGILSALVMDLQHRGDSSALFSLARSMVYLTAILGLASFPLYWTIGVLIAVGAAVVFYFDPRGVRAAYAQGFGTLAAVMTLMPGDAGEAIGAPYDAAAPLPVIDEKRTGEPAPLARSEEAPVMRMASFVPLGMGGVPLETKDEADVPVADELGGYSIKVRIAFPGGVPEPIALKMKQGRIKGRLYNPATDRTYNLFLSAGGPIVREDDRLLIETTIPGKADQTTLFLRLEAEGYEIATVEETVTQGANPVWDVALSPTSEPLLLQRLKHSYAF